MVTAYVERKFVEVKNIMFKAVHYTEIASEKVEESGSKGVLISG